VLTSPRAFETPGGAYRLARKRPNRQEALENKLCGFGAGFFSSGKAAGSTDTGGISGFCQRSMTEKRQAKCIGCFQALTQSRYRRYSPDERNELKLFFVF
jgi:hypothetical protein